MVWKGAAEVDVTAGLEVCLGAANQSYDQLPEAQSVTISPCDWEDLQKRWGQGEEEWVREPPKGSSWARRRLAELVAEVQKEEMTSHIMLFLDIHAFTHSWN